MSSILESQAIEQLVTQVEEAARSTDEGIKYFVEPAPEQLSRTTNRRHHLVFGRRGSGKSSLLRKAKADLTVKRTPISYVDLETYKGHSYPDVLLSVLISTFQGFQEWLKTAAINSANNTTYWKRLFGSIPDTPAYKKSL